MTNPNDVQQMIGRTAVDSDGTKIGKIGQVYLDDQTGQPVWATVKTGMFGSKDSFAPLYGSKPVGEDLQLAVSKDLVKDLPPKAGRVSRRSLPTETGANWSTSPGGRPSVRSRGPVPMRDNRPSDSVSGQGCRSACSYCKVHLPDQDS